MKINPAQLHAVRPLRPGPVSKTQQLQEAREVRTAFRSFVGQTFFGQMLKSMRSTLDKPAYFHGGQAEEVFRNQLDQVLSEKMTEASADQIADPMFRQQFPRQAQLLAQETKSRNPSLADLQQLTRR